MSSLVDTYAMPSNGLLASHDGACRYIAHNQGKCVTAAQVAHIHGLGKNVVLNFEDEPTNAKGGAEQGSKDAEFALGISHEIGAPQGVVIFYSVDYEATAGQLATIVDYFRGVKAEHAGTGILVGAYGDNLVVGHLLGAGVIDLGWQTASWSGTSRDRDVRAVLYQDHFTAGYDVDEIEQPFYGAWTPSGPQPNPTEDDMTPADWTKLDAAFKTIETQLAAIAQKFTEPNPAGVRVGESIDSIVAQAVGRHVDPLVQAVSTLTAAVKAKQ